MFKKAEKIRKNGKFKHNGVTYNFLSYTVYPDGWVSLANDSGKYFNIEEVEEVENV